MEDQMSSQATQGTKLRDRLKLGQPNFCYADLHSEVIKNVNNIPPTSSGNHQKQQVERKAIENEELVKYMSNLPSYLERGEKLQEKAFNVGVLDWRRLEKWRYNNRQVPCRGSRNSSSSSNTSSFSSTDGTSTHSSRGHSCSPAHQRMHRPTIPSDPNASPTELYSKNVKTLVENVGKFQDLNAASSDSLNGQQTILRKCQSFKNGHSEIKLKECKKKDSIPLVVPKIKSSLDLENNRVATHSKGKMKIQEGESTKRVENLEEPSRNMIDHDCPDRNKTAVLLFPRDGTENNHFATSCPSDLTETNGQRSSELNQRSFPEESFSKELDRAELYSGTPQSGLLPCEVGDKHSQIKQPSSIYEKSTNFLCDASQPSLSSAKTSIGPSRGKNLEEKSTTMPTNPTVIKYSKGPDLKMSTVAAPKVRNSSPTRFRIGMGRIGRSSSLNDGSAMPPLSSRPLTAKSGTKKAVPPTVSDNSGSEKPSDASRALSSPLKRLLGPLLTPKAANSHHSEPSWKDSTSVDKAFNSSNGRLEYSTVHSMKVKLDLSTCRTINVDDSHHNEKRGPSALQALLKISIKNGLPLFTFAVDNNSDILAATMRKLSNSRKDENSWIYTFFTIHEAKKKNGWISQGGKGKGHGYIPNVVAQMKVSDSQFSKLIRHNSMGQFGIREFVLFSVNLRQADQQTSDLEPSDELAAIVVNFPKGTLRGLNQDVRQSDKLNYVPVIGLKGPLPKVRSDCTSRDNEENESSGSQGIFSTTVILPGDVHGLPKKGEPSPLIERWKSGGACDCGGWDLGCRIRIISNQTQLSKGSSSSKAHTNAGQFELFSQGEVVDNRPVFSLSPLKDGIFSVEFSSSFSLLQAFSICVAVLNSRKPFELSELSNLSKEKSSGETTSVESDGKKCS